MIQRFSTYLALVTIGLAGLTNCKKDDPFLPHRAATKTDVLTAKSWKVTDIKIADKSIFRTALVDSCAKDDLTKFNANKSVTFNEGAFKCEESSPQSRTGAWEFTTDETKLKVTDSDGSVLEAAIRTLNTTTLTITDPDFAGPGVAAEVTYTAQEAPQ
jgi:hypothetical protein